MTVKQLKEKLSAFPDEMDVFFSEIQTGFNFAPVEMVYQKEMNMLDGEDGKVLATQDVVVLDEF